MNVIIIEDEKLAAQNLEKLLLDIDKSITIQAKIGTVREAIAWLMQNKTDLIFLDIQLSDGISFKIFETVEVKTPIIFTTAYDHYAIKAFDVNSIAYLLKPIKAKELERSLKKYKDTISEKTQTIDYSMLLNLISNKLPEYQKRFIINAGQKIKTIPIEAIAYFYVIEKSVFLCTHQNERYALEYSLDNLETLLDPSLFFRVNRQQIIHISAIANMYNLSNRSIKIELKPPSEQETIVSILRLSDFKKWLNR
jgi:DNA-binding LytR/AlgR family response regulator